MANVDRPNGFVPVKTLSGAPWTGLIRTVGVADSDNIFVGDIINLESGLADVGATGDTAILGVAVGFGKRDPMTGRVNGAYGDPSDIDTIYYNDAISTHTDYVVFYAPADDVIFEAQTNAALSSIVVGTTFDLVDATGGNTSVGISTAELATTSNGDFTVVEVPEIIGNTPQVDASRYWVMVTRASQAFHA